MESERCGRAQVDYRAFVALAAAAGRGCRVHAALQSDVGSDRVAEGSTAHIRAAASNVWAQGVHGLYLASWSAPAVPAIIQGSKIV